MNLVTTYILLANRRRFKIELPFSIDIEEGLRAEIFLNGAHLKLRIRRRVDSTNLACIEEANAYRELPDGKQVPVFCIVLQDDSAPEHIVAEDLVSTFSFLTDLPMGLSSPHGEDYFEPEDEADEQLLRAFGTNRPCQELSVSISVRAFDERVTEDIVKSLIPRRAGIRLYANALRSSLETAQFRAFWLVLESAFGRKDRPLVDLVAQYPPALEMEFTEQEIRELWILRGRASHAESRSGVKELALVSRMCSDSLPRLKNLVERVIVTKRTWGVPSAGIDEVLDLSGYTGPGNEGIRAGKPPADRH